MLKFLAKFWRRGMDSYREEGYDAYFLGYDQTDCPYNENSYAGAEWLRGWNEADRLPLVEDRDYA